MSDVTALGRSDLNRFLFATIGTEANGSTLSVMSVFARRGTDPWTEASRLATLTKADATDSLADMIASMPKSLWALPDAVTIAARLTGLLPARSTGATKLAGRWPVGPVTLAVACAGFVAAILMAM